MSGKSKRNVERALRAHYRAERGAPDAEAKAATLAAVRAAVASERPAGERGGGMTFAGFVAVQARFIHPRVWAAQLALVAIMAAVCLPSSGMARGFSVVSGMLAAATVLVGLPDLLASATHRVSELEYACRFDCRAVALARLIVLGCSDVVAVTAIALAAPIALGADPFASLVHACVPYFLACAGALLAARRFLFAGVAASMRVDAARDGGGVCGARPRARRIRPGVDVGVGARGGRLARLGRARSAHVARQHRGRPRRVRARIDAPMSPAGAVARAHRDSRKPSQSLADLMTLR